MTAATASPGRVSPGGWIASPGWDLFWMFSALWGAALLLGGSWLAPIELLAFALLGYDRIVSTCHAWSTTFMVLGSPLLREERRRRRVRYGLAPLLIALGAMALGVGVGFGQRFPSDGRLSAGLWAFGLYICLFWVGHFWHFGQQDFGVLSIYRVKAGQGRPLDRKVDRLYTAGMMFVVQPIVYLHFVRTTAFSEIVHALLPLPSGWMFAAARAAIGAALLGTLGVVAFELAKPRRSLPRLLYLGVVGAHPLLLFASVHFKRPDLGYVYLITYLWSHWFIAIGLVSRLHVGHLRSGGDSRALAVAGHLALMAMITGAVLLLAQDFEQYRLFNTPGFRYKEILGGIPAGGELLVGLALGFFLMEQLVHYYCDRCLFRFREPAVRARVAPLLL